MRIQITVKNGLETVATIVGRVDHGDIRFTISKEDQHKVIETEQYLERLTGLRFHIEGVA